MCELSLDMIFRRRSVRSYTNQAISDEIIEQLLAAGMSGPTACDKKTPEFEHITPISALSFGYPTKEPEPRKRFFPEHVHYDQW